MRRLVLALAPLLLTLEAPALAQAPAWRVSEVSGDVRITEAGRTRPATRGALLASGATILTAPRARAVLVRGREYVVVSPGSRIRIATTQQQGPRGFIQVFADWGTALFRIERRATPHFGVQTPYLAAVVKGTVFTVTVGQSGASVQVTEGAVEVSTVDGGAAEMVRPGMVAMVASSDLLQLNVEGETSRAIRSNGTPAAGVVTVPASDAGRYEGPADAPVSVPAPVTEGEISLGDVTDGLIAGRGGPDLAMTDIGDVRDGGSPDDRGAGTENAGGPGNGSPAGDSGAGDESGSGNDNGTPASGDTGNNGHGNDDDGNDAGNPGNGGGGPGSGDDDGNNGHGNDDDGDDAGNPGNGGEGGGNSGPGSGDNDGNNGGGNDDDGDDAGNPGNGGGGPGSGDDDGNNGGGNDDDGDDAGNPGNGGGGPSSGDDDGNNGGGNDDDGDDAGNPGNGGGGDDDDDSGPGNGNGNGNGGNRDPD